MQIFLWLNDDEEEWDGDAGLADAAENGLPRLEPLTPKPRMFISLPLTPEHFFLRDVSVANCMSGY